MREVECINCEKTYLQIIGFEISKKTVLVNCICPNCDNQETLSFKMNKGKIEFSVI